MSNVYLDIASSYNRRRGSAGSFNSDCSAASPPPVASTIAELFWDQWSPEFAARYIYSFSLNHQTSSDRASVCSSSLSELPASSPTSPRLPLPATSIKLTDEIALSIRELPTRENDYCVSNFSLEKIALYSQRHGGVDRVVDKLARSVPVELKASFCMRIRARITKLMEKRKQMPLCGFCRNNGKPPQCYLSHTTRDATGKVSCPILLNYQCPRCGATGRDAHTTSYCPLNAITNS